MSVELPFSIKSMKSILFSFSSTKCMHIYVRAVSDSPGVRLRLKTLRDRQTSCFQIAIAPTQVLIGLELLNTAVPPQSFLKNLLEGVRYLFTVLLHIGIVP